MNALTRTVLAGVLLVLAACDGPLAAPPVGGTLQLQFGAEARTLTPSEPGDVTSIDVTGFGPGGATLSLKGLLSGASTGRQVLAVGPWTIAAVGRNGQGTAVASGSVTVTIVAGQDTSATLTLVPLTGSGAVSITVSWPPGFVAAPSVRASLAPAAGGSSIPLAVSPVPRNPSAQLDASAVPAGSYLLTAVLLDDTVEISRGVEAVRVAQGMTTTGSLGFVYDPGLGIVALGLIVDTNRPLSVTVTADAASLPAGTTTVLRASADAAATERRWYVNGLLQANEAGATFLFGPGRTAGMYRIDVLVLGAGRIGSASVVVTVTGTSPP